MTMKTEPFLEGKYGWSFGESNWNGGVDENFLKFSYMLNANVDGFVSSLPGSPINGTAYFLSTDSTINARVDGAWYKFPIPVGFVVREVGTGDKFEWDGSVMNPVAVVGAYTLKTDTTTNYNVLADDKGKYIRLTNAATKTVTFRPETTEALPQGGVWNFRNVGAGDATLVAGSGVTLTANAGGTLVFIQDATVSVVRVAEDEFDVIGQTVAV